MRKALFIISLFITCFINAQEICNNGIDDDGDGLIDLNDNVDCACTGFSTSQTIPSLIPNPSFEQNTCCPSSFSQLNCATGWIQATAATSDYFNTCGFTSGAATGNGLVPPPNGNGYVGAIFTDTYKEYVGSCLTSSMVAGNSYNLNMQIASCYADGSLGYVGSAVPPPINIVIYGSTGCLTSPLNTSDCPGSGWDVIAIQSYTPANSWGVINFVFTPTVNINSIIIGPPCVVPSTGYSGSNYAYFYFDNLILNTSSSFVSTNINEVGSFCGNNLALNASADSSGGSWQWYKNGIALVGQTTATLNISTNNLGSGKYTTRYTIGNKCATVDKTLTAPPLPSANFNLTNGCLNTVSNFSSTTTPTANIVSQIWNYGDNSSVVTGSLVSHSYLSAGTYTVKLVVSDAALCKDSVIKPIIIYPKPAIAISSGAVCSGFATSFTNTSSVPLPDYISNWYWDFDNNGTTDNITQTPSYTYSSSGTYTAELKAKTGFGCLDSSVTQLVINPLPTVAFTATNVCMNSNVQLSNSSTISVGSISSWSWNFGANSTPLSSTNAAPSLSYSTSGIQTITLSATSTHSCTASMTNTVLIYPDPVPAFTFTNTCVNSQPFNFDASGSTIPVGTNTLYSWAYGDGNSSSGAMVSTSHSYLTAGLYNATLTVTSDQGCTHALSKQVEIYPKPLATISVGQTCLGSATQFTANTLPSSGNINQWLWDLNNTKSSIEATGQQSSYVFGTAGTQTVTLITVTDRNCMDTVSGTTYINYNPQPQFVVDKTAGCSPHCVTFTDNTPAISSPAKIVSWNWIFGNGTSVNSATNGSQSRCYTNSSSSQPTLFNVTLVTVTDSACSNMITKSNYITVYPKPIAAYFPNPNPGNIVTPLVYFTNQSQDYNKFYWYFGDSPLIDSTGINPTHLYSDASTATYNSALIVSNQYNCKDTAYVQIEIGPEFTFYIPNAFTPEDGNVVNDVFTGKGIGIIKYEMWIYDRWGVNLFYTDDINKGWDGRIKGKDEVAKQDVYTWKVKLKDVFNKPHEYVGHVTLIR